MVFRYFSTRQKSSENVLCLMKVLLKNILKFTVILVPCKLRQLGLPNPIVDNSNSNDDEFGHQLQYDSKSDEKIRF